MVNLSCPCHLITVVFLVAVILREEFPRYYGLSCLLFNMVIHWTHFGIIATVLGALSPEVTTTVLVLYCAPTLTISLLLSTTITSTSFKSILLSFLSYYLSLNSVLINCLNSVLINCLNSVLINCSNSVLINCFPIFSPSSSYIYRETNKWLVEKLSFCLLLT